MPSAPVPAPFPRDPHNPVTVFCDPSGSSLARRNPVLQTPHHPRDCPVPVPPISATHGSLPVSVTRSQLQPFTFREERTLVPSLAVPLPAAHPHALGNGGRTPSSGTRCASRCPPVLGGQRPEEGAETQWGEPSDPTEVGTPHQGGQRGPHSALRPSAPPTLLPTGLRIDTGLFGHIRDIYCWRHLPCCHSCQHRPAGPRCWVPAPHPLPASV